MQEQELNSQTHTTETISYIAWEPSSGTVGNLTFEVEKTDDVITDNLQTIVYNETFMATPVFLADMQTTNGGDTANLRWQNKDFYRIDIKITEEQSYDSEISHTTEVVGYMMFAKIDIGMDTDVKEVELCRHEITDFGRYGLKETRGCGALQVMESQGSKGQFLFLLHKRPTDEPANRTAICLSVNGKP